jgi:hypothetical protein
VKKLLTAAACLAIATPAGAVTSGTVSGSTTIAYACDMTLPGDITMTQSSTTTATGTDTMPYAQNAGTTYTLSALTFTHPVDAALATAEISFIDKDSASVVSNSSEASTATGTIAGVESGTGSIAVSVVDTVLAAGNYAVSATLSCSETP